jgi:hypothetical protein
MTSLVVLILHGVSLARQIHPILVFLGLAHLSLLHELSLSRQQIQATKHAPPASDGPGQGACGQPNAPLATLAWLGDERCLEGCYVVKKTSAMAITSWNLAMAPILMICSHVGDGLHLGRLLFSGGKSLFNFGKNQVPKQCGSFLQVSSLTSKPNLGRNHSRNQRGRAELWSLHCKGESLSQV